MPTTTPTRQQHHDHTHCGERPRPPDNNPTFRHVSPFSPRPRDRASAGYRTTGDTHAIASPAPAGQTDGGIDVNRGAVVERNRSTGGSDALLCQNKPLRLALLLTQSSDRLLGARRSPKNWCRRTNQPIRERATGGSQLDRGRTSRCKPNSCHADLATIATIARTSRISTESPVLPIVGRPRARSWRIAGNGG